jgi:hypothetical protein
VKKPLIWKAFGAIVFLASVLAFAPPGAASEDKLSEPGWLVDYIDRVPPILMEEVKKGGVLNGQYSLSGATTEMHSVDEGRRDGYSSPDQASEYDLPYRRWASLRLCHDHPKRQGGFGSS